ncbi:MAG: DUF192 domain-containing protein [Erythrobacteraceae bacterium]|jgi:uncharacterized membrane protein (UPF0127 family)|nr:DUF192 domain-containing protein [Erythrobacteraceae bacterium]
MVRFWLVAGMAALAACSPGEGATARAQAPDAPISDAPVRGEDGITRHPLSGLQVIDLVVMRGEQRLPFKVELAASEAAQARGLMFREELGDDEGMLFPSDPPQPRSFWMKNTPLSLDIIFIGTDGRISNIEADTVPYSLAPVRSVGFATAVLELRAGRAKELGIMPGDRVIWEIP